MHRIDTSGKDWNWIEPIQGGIGISGMIETRLGPIRAKKSWLTAELAELALSAGRSFLPAYAPDELGRPLPDSVTPDPEVIWGDEGPVR